MLRWYQQCRTLPEPHIKVIANAKHVRTVISPHPHNVYYKCDVPFCAVATTPTVLALNIEEVEHNCRVLEIFWLGI